MTMNRSCIGKIIDWVQKRCWSISFCTHNPHMCPVTVTMRAAEQHCSSPLTCLENVAASPYSPCVRCRNLHPSSSQVSTSTGHGPALFWAVISSPDSRAAFRPLSLAPCPAGCADSLERRLAAWGCVLSSHPPAYRAEIQEGVSHTCFLLQGSQLRRKILSARLSF